MKQPEPTVNDNSFAALRRKIRQADLLTEDAKELLRSLRFSGRLSLVVKNGSILKSGYEEGYFTRQQDERMIP